jgi:hypothetical protein
VQRVRRAATLSILACLAAAPATASEPVRFSITGFDLLQVNQVVVHVKPGGSHPLCQAIPITAIRVKVRWSKATKGRRATVALVEPGGTRRTRRISLAARSGARKVQFDPRGEFREGTYRAAVGKARATFRLTPGRTC